MTATAAPMVPVGFRVSRRARETTDTWTLELEPQSGDATAFAPGQFNMVYAFGIGEVPISISGDPTRGGPLVHTVRAVGSVTEAICASEPGQMLGIRGPYGSAWPVAEAEGGDLVVVAGGLGLAPLRPAVLEAIAGRTRFQRLLLLCGGREPEQLLYREELRRWAEAPEVEVAVTVDAASPGWTGEVGLVTKLVGEAEFDPARTVALLCGPEIMMRFTARALEARGVARERIHLSIERNMKCAVTQCGRCVFGSTYACREGPVMRLSEIYDFFATREV